MGLLEYRTRINEVEVHFYLFIPCSLLVIPIFSPIEASNGKKVVKKFAVVVGK
jgi:hypothetical protein